MAETDKKVVLATRVFQRVKDDLNNRAEALNKTLSHYTEQVLNNHCDGSDKDSEVIVLKSNIEQLEKENQSLQTEITALKLQAVANSVKENWREEQEILLSKIEDLEQTNSQLSEDIATQDRLSSSIDMSIQLSNKTRFKEHLKHLQSKHPSFTPEQILELAVGCAYQNSKNFLFVNTLGDYVKANIDFFTSKTIPHASSDI